MSFLSAEKYRIREVDYTIEGATKESALDRKFPVDRNRVFESQDELLDYVDALKVKYGNERNFESSEIECLIDDEENSDSEIRDVRLAVSVCDSKHLLVLPYPKYDSNSGISAKLKLKDTNFAGTLNELNADVFYETELDEEDEEKTNKKIGGNFEYRFPFSLGKVRATWNNRDNITYTAGKSKPEYDVNTGFTFELPLERVSFVLDLNQQLSENFEYIKYDDEFFGRSTGKFSVPFLLSESKVLSKVTWAPYVLADCSYDSNGINVANNELTGPELFGGHQLSFGQINWKKNFRNGFSVVLDNRFGWNFQRDYWIPEVTLEIQAFKAFERIGFNTRLLGFAMNNRTMEFGTRLRGITDKRYYAMFRDKYGFRCSSVKEECGIIGNFDVPVSIFTTDFGQFFDFEFQAAPFVDFALVSNQKTKRFLALKDGFYTAGMEFLVYPLKWKSIVVRASAGFDVSEIFDFESGSCKSVNTWNKKCKKYELFVGIGWHY